ETATERGRACRSRFRLASRRLDPPATGHVGRSAPPTGSSAGSGPASRERRRSEAAIWRGTLPPDIGRGPGGPAPVGADAGRAAGPGSSRTGARSGAGSQRRLDSHLIRSTLITRAPCQSVQANLWRRSCPPRLQIGTRVSYMFQYLKTTFRHWGLLFSS